MMMRALEAGGLNSVYNQSRDVMKDRFADESYDPNIGGLYELSRTEYRLGMDRRVELITDLDCWVGETKTDE